MTQASQIRILVIDDDQVSRETLAFLLRSEGYQTLEAGGGKEGIRLALRTPPRLVLCDLLMPGVDGFGVLARLRAEPATSAVPFIFITASTSNDDSRVGFMLGANDYVTKPVDPATLLALVRERLNPEPAA